MLDHGSSASQSSVPESARFSPSSTKKRALQLERGDRLSPSRQPRSPSGTVTGSGGGSASGSAGVDLQVCLDARVDCDLSCAAPFGGNLLDVAAQAACVAGCGLDLATCLSAGAGASGSASDSGH